ncbi:hypothetical protein Q5762_14790 [Streptomyces sp. P9(2023)]|uniref:hypothetical protein n=1 Tax=Streptomyces sp. P9(2023) TaxID=3064394 RepID=UPI0028F3ED0A|nr:hypothetical protein [Streptomyces sp. P9(2023)]MDT9689581.1 hypothetical protein [Streptomyces sp. P9(2023)]
MPLNEGHDGFEDELGAALRRTGDGFATEGGRELVTGGLVRGRRRVKRRRVAAVTSGVLAFAVVGVGGVYGGDLLRSGGGGQDTQGASVAAPKDRTAPAVQKPGGGQPTIPIKNLAAVLRANTPAGTWTIDDESGVGEAVSGVYEDGKGKAGVSVGLYRAGEGGEAGADQVKCPDKAYVPHDACTSERLPNGDRLMVFQGYEYPDRRTDTKNWRAVLLTRDGFLVDASEYNAPTAKDSDVSRTDPPFSPAQLKTLVTAAGWRPLFKQLAVPEKALPGADPAGVPPLEPDGEAVQATLRSLLPKGLKVVSKGGEGEFAYVVVNDGKGKSLVQINVQNGMSDVAAQLAAGGTKLPGGRLVKVTKQPGAMGGAGVVWWTAESLTKSGFRVVVSAFNTGAQHEPATRSKPALTLEQLKTIALSEKWATFEAK